MPRWLPIARDYAATRKRFSIQGSISELLSGILPTYQLERNWNSEFLDLWGIEGFVDAMNGNHGAISLHNISDAFPREEQRELLVWRMNAELFTRLAAATLLGFSLHQFTPIGNYNPHVIPGATPIFLPWFQPAKATGELARFPLAGHLDAGSNAALDVVTVNGVPVTVVGPVMTMRQGRTQAGSSVAGGLSNMEFGLNVDAPPFRVKPGERVTIQTLEPHSSSFTTLRVVVWYSERPFTEGL